MTKRIGILVLSVALVCMWTASVSAEVAVASIFGNHMVMQQDKTLPVWGTAAPGEPVRVTLDKQAAKTVTKPDGRWQVKMKPMKTGGPYTLTITGPKNSITLEDVLIGEVWICSGQSNMEWPLRAANDADAEIAAANYPEIRLFVVNKNVAVDPQTACVGEWKVCAPDTVPDFSAVGYFFGRMLNQELKRPVGMIESAWGGTPAESWTSLPTLQASPELLPIVENFAAIEKAYPEAKAKFDTDLEAWKVAAEQAKTQGQPEPAKPSEPMSPNHPYRPASLYNGMIYPLAPYALRGAIWYQGESNASRAKQYQTLFPAMINDWRNLWGQGPFPFYFVQLANYMERKDAPQPESEWAALREAQTLTLKQKNTGMAVTIDIGEAADIHPRNKQDVGKRLALNALAKVYAKKVPYSGPLYLSMQVMKNEAWIAFTNTDSGLNTKDSGPLKGFMIAGADGKFVWADARIEGRRVVVRSDQVPVPVAVRYAWADNPDCNLYNGAGLPASPFRTDQ